MLIGNTLKKLRESRKLTVEQVTKYLSISTSSYRKYEYNEREPSTDIIVELADFYGVTTDYLLGREPQKNPIAMLNLAIGEKEVMEKYIGLPKEVRKIILDTMIQLAGAAKQGLEKNNKPPVIVFKHFSVNKASAGCGYDLDDSDGWQELSVIDTPEAREADFAVEIDGHSMEPTYYDGDIVYIVTDLEVPVGKIGLFRQNNKGYIKEVGEHCLISHNDNYPDIYPEDGEIESIGRVIGKAELPE